MLLEEVSVCQRKKQAVSAKSSVGKSIYNTKLLAFKCLAKVEGDKLRNGF